jgi:hypothetical protein
VSKVEFQSSGLGSRECPEVKKTNKSSLRGSGEREAKTGYAGLDSQSLENNRPAETLLCKAERALPPGVLAPHTYYL